MSRFFSHVLSAPLLGGIFAAVLVGCSTRQVTPDGHESGVAGTEAKPVAPAAPELTAAEWSLLEMNFDEAKAISTQHAEVGAYFRVAGDSVEVLKSDKEGKPVKVRAKGHVFLEMPLMNRATALCEEAVVSVREAHLQGTPMLKQGARVARATGKGTTFWVSDRLQVLGRFDLVKLDGSNDTPSGSSAADVALAEILRTPGSGPGTMKEDLGTHH